RTACQARLCHSLARVAAKYQPVLRAGFVGTVERVRAATCRAHPPRPDNAALAARNGIETARGPIGARRLHRDRSVKLIFACVVSLCLLQPRQAIGYSVLAHESNVDALWDTHIRPLLLQKYPKASATQLQEARAYCY